MSLYKLLTNFGILCNKYIVNKSNESKEIVFARESTEEYESVANKYEELLLMNTDTKLYCMENNLNETYFEELLSPNLMNIWYNELQQSMEFVDANITTENN